MRVTGVLPKRARRSASARPEGCSATAWSSLNLPKLDQKVHPHRTAKWLFFALAAIGLPQSYSATSSICPMMFALSAGRSSAGIQYSRVVWLPT